MMRVQKVIPRINTPDKPIKDFLRRLIYHSVTVNGLKLVAVIDESPYLYGSWSGINHALKNADIELAVNLKFHLTLPSTHFITGLLNTARFKYKLFKFVV